AGEIATGKNIRAAQQVAQQAAIDRYRRAVGVGDGQAERFFSRRLAMAEDLEEHRVEPFQQEHQDQHYTVADGTEKQHDDRGDDVDDTANQQVDQEGGGPWHRTGQ